METWMNGKYQEAVCAHCGVVVSTHPDAGNPWAGCGDCGVATCPDCRVDDQAQRCVTCAAVFYAVGGAGGPEVGR